MSTMMLARLGEFIKYCVQYACITHCTFEYIGDFVVCNGPSMEPTLHSNNILLTERISPRFQRPCRGDIVIAISPVDPTQFICKRVVGLSGDKITTTLSKNDEAYANPNPNTVPIEGAERAQTTQVVEGVVPRGYVWIEGDNTSNSSDSRYYGPIPQGLIKSRVICRLWPPSEMSLF